MIAAAVAAAGGGVVGLVFWLQSVEAAVKRLGDRVESLEKDPIRRRRADG